MKNRVSYHKAAFHCFQQTFFSSFFLCTSQALLWLIFIYGAFVSHRHLGYAALFFLIPCLLLIFVYRFYVTHWLSLRLQPNTPPLKSFIRLLPAALWRMIAGAAWLLPFAAVAFRFYQYIFVLPATTFTGDFTQIGAFIAKDVSLATQLLIGTITFFALLMLTFILFLYGWRRGNSFDMTQAADLTFTKSLKKARILRKRTRKARAINTVIHTLILLPAIVIPVILPLAQLSPLLTGKAMNDIQLIYAYLSAGIVSSGTLVISACIFLALYLPWHPFRKLHNIAVMGAPHE